MCKRILRVKVLLVALGIPLFAFAQKPFDCSGRNFRVVEEGGGSMLQEIMIDPITLDAEFVDLHHFQGFQINGICYRPNDNYIYGILLEDPYVLCRIDGAFNIERLTKLELPSNFLFVAGDISPDGKHLVLLSSSRDEPTNLLARINLDDPGYETSVVPMIISNGGRAIFCADIAFHPTTGVLYGFNDTDDRIISIDIDKRLIENEKFPVQNVLKGNVPSLFFDVSGNLMAIGASRESNSSRSLFKFDLPEGNIELIEKYGMEGNQDGCSCPYVIHVLNEVKSRKLYPCTEQVFEITLINRSPFEQFDLVLRDTFPADILVKEVRNLPFSNTNVTGIGSSVLTIEGLNLPVGTFKFEVLVEVKPSVVLGGYSNQVYLHNIDYAYIDGLDVARSDDPQTTEKDDPTNFFVDRLSIHFDEDDLILCKGESLELDPRVGEGVSYLWNTGERTPSITIERPGNYSLLVQTGCDRKTGSIDVKEVEVSISLGPDRLVEKGAELNLEPTIRTNTAIGYYYWKPMESTDELPCSTCPSNRIKVQKASTYLLEVGTIEGCKDVDELSIFFEKSGIYIPNAFSPNDDGWNDVFFVQGKSDYSIRYFQVFDRWGNRLFHHSGGLVNDKNFGWNGKIKGKVVPEGVYVWQASIELLDGTIEEQSGDVLLRL